MTDTVRCPACRGAKKVPKLGGMIGECNTCKGEGSILASDKPVPVVAAVETVVEKDLLKAVSECVPVTTITRDIPLHSDKVQVDSITIGAQPMKIEPEAKKNIFRKKKA